MVFFNDQADAMKLKPNYPAAGLSITDDRVLTQVSAITGASRGTYVTNLACNSVTDSRCSGADNLRISAVIPPCTAKSDVQDVCIKSLRTADSTGTLKDAQLLYEIDTFKFPRDTANRIPAGGGISVWQGSSIKGGTLEYSVAVDIQINYYRSTPSSPTSSRPRSASARPRKRKRAAWTSPTTAKKATATTPEPPRRELGPQAAHPGGLFLWGTPPNNAPTPSFGFAFSPDGDSMLYTINL